MRTGLAYTSARILLLIIAMWLLYLAGARGFLLIALAFVVSALASYVLLSKQRDTISDALNRRLSKAGRRAAEFRSRLEEGAAAEDGAQDDADDDSNRVADLAEAKDRG
jgi:hypothetical protein